MTEYTKSDVVDILAALPAILERLELGNGKLWLRLGSGAKDIQRCGKILSINELIRVPLASMIELFGQKWTTARSALRQGTLNNGYTYDKHSMVHVISVCDRQHSDGVCPKEGIFLKARSYLDKNGKDVFQVDEIRDRIDKKIDEFRRQRISQQRKDKELSSPPRNDRPAAATISPPHNENESDSVPTLKGESQNDTTPVDQHNNGRTLIRNSEENTTAHHNKRRRGENGAVAVDIDVEEDENVPDEGMDKVALDIQEIAEDAKKYFEDKVSKYKNKADVQIDICLQDLAHSILAQMLSSCKSDIMVSRNLVSFLLQSLSNPNIHHIKLTQVHL